MTKIYMIAIVCAVCSMHCASNKALHGTFGVMNRTVYALQEGSTTTRDPQHLNGDEATLILQSYRSRIGIFDNNINTQSAIKPGASH